MCVSPVKVHGEENELTDDNSDHSASESIDVTNHYACGDMS